MAAKAPSHTADAGRATTTNVPEKINSPYRRFFTDREGGGHHAPSDSARDRSGRNLCKR